MKIKGFLKLLNRKINKYDKAASNPFEATPLTITLVWVENDAQAGMKSGIWTSSDPQTAEAGRQTEDEFYDTAVVTERKRRNAAISDCTGGK